ncbi:Rho-type GTPase activating protein Rga1, partial [Coemansia sp. RSA 2559]
GTLDLKHMGLESTGHLLDVAANDSMQQRKPSPASSGGMNAVTKAAMKAAKNEGDVVQVLDAPTDLSPPQVLADRRKTRVAHTPVHMMRARMENKGHASTEDPGSPTGVFSPEYPHAPLMQRRPGQIATGTPSHIGLSKNGMHVPPSLSNKPTKLRRLSDENDASRAETAAAMVATTTMNDDAEAASVSRVKTMLSRPHTMRFVSDLNAAELFCAKHVAVSRLTALLGGQSDISQADMVALIGATKKTTGAGMWSRLKTNLMKKDGGAGGGGSGGSGNGTKDRMRTATFGVPLETLMERQSAETELGAHGKQKLQVPQFFELMLTTLKTMDMTVEGIFRKNGNIRRLREVADAVDKDFSRVDLKKDAPVQIAALLKKFLREMPDPLIPFRMRRL